MSIFQKHVLGWSSQTLGWSMAQETKDQTLTDLSFPWTLRTQPSEHTAPTVLCTAGVKFQLLSYCINSSRLLNISVFWFPDESSQRDKVSQIIKEEKHQCVSVFRLGVPNCVDKFSDFLIVRQIWPIAYFYTFRKFHGNDKILNTGTKHPGFLQIIASTLICDSTLNICRPWKSGEWIEFEGKGSSSSSMTLVKWWYLASLLAWNSKRNTVLCCDVLLQANKIVRGLSVIPYLLLHNCSQSMGWSNKQ